MAIVRCLMDNDFSSKFNDFQNTLYRDIFECKKINRSKWEDKNSLDINDHIDVILDDKITIQEKVLRYEHLHYNTFTIEFMQDRFNNTKGEFFDIKADYYLHGYSNKEEDRYLKFGILKVKELIEFLKTNMNWTIINDKNSNASFLAIEYNKLSNNIFLFKYNLEDKHE